MSEDQVIDEEPMPEMAFVLVETGDMELLIIPLSQIKNPVTRMATDLASLESGKSIIWIVPDIDKPKRLEEVTFIMSGGK